MTKPAQDRSLTLYPEEYAICKLPPSDPVPAWAIGYTASFFSITRTGDELSVICPQAQLPPDVAADRGWRCLKLNGPFPLDEPGVLAAVVTPLAAARLSVFAVASFDTDHLLVQKLDPAIVALEGAGYRILRQAS